jgi:hypothetical protein
MSFDPKKDKAQVHNLPASKRKNIVQSENAAMVQNCEDRVR